MQYFSVTETAKEIRKALKTNFQGIKFSVRSDKYAGGASINVSWIDGPTDHAVSEITNKFAGATFDGMIDMKEYHDTEYNGENVHFGADFIFTRREMSDELVETACNAVLEFWGWQGVTAEALRQAFRTGRTYELSEMLCFDDRMLSRQISDALELVGNFDPDKEEKDRILDEAYAAQKAANEEAATKHKETEIVPLSVNDVEEENQVLISLRFPIVNKNNWIEDYQAQLENEDDYHVINGQIERVVNLTPHDYDQFIHQLLHDRTWLTKQGGTGTTEDVPEIPFWELTEDEQTAFHAGAYNLVTQVMAEDRETLYVDPQGHSYAMYVAFVRMEEHPEEISLEDIFPILTTVPNVEQSYSRKAARA